MLSPLTFRGGSASLVRSYLHGDPEDRKPPLESLLDGPRGTTKSVTNLAIMHRLCMEFPGVAAAMTRRVRKDMTRTTLVTFERDIVHPNHPCLLHPQTGHYSEPANRRQYVYPNGSRIDVIGLDRAGQGLSADYDLIYCNELIEYRPDDYQTMLGSLRGYAFPWGSTMLCDTNPDTEISWVNRRPMLTHTMKRYLSRHIDNPRWYNRDGTLTPEGEKYMAMLNGLTGPLRDRHLHGKWVSAEGLFFHNFDRSTHVVGARPSDVQFYYGGQDFGDDAPGCLQIWAMSSRGASYLIEEHYRCRKDLDWWAERIVSARRRYGDKLRYIQADPAEPKTIRHQNKALRQKGYVSIVHAANNKTDPGYRVLRDLIGGPGNPPRLYIVADALDSRCPIRDERALPCGLIEELLSLSYAEKKETSPEKDKPDPTGSDHAVDACRYAQERAFRGTAGRMKVPDVTASPTISQAEREWLGDDP
jgi:hypothetical protein